ncbi:hypothetical protein MUCCIDRAFT_77710 [Mucor lusitanicus CBS 277.49]|uniref:Uncharacterized protein n=1 Tax=Mucor lusitanicus CBS 277.49 TaxID=747725 RepID=A0A168P816_MUCCL|nr:hypothetical protein MUCCIDRAFT_77710 [Mucor lusitanicus CBS 277.49]
MKDFIVQEYGQQPLDAYKEDWKRRFKEVATALKCTTGRSAHDNWNLVATAIQEEATTIVDTAATLTYQKKLSQADKQAIATHYAKIKHKWDLKSGRAVEDVINDVAKDFCHDHPLRSFILNIDDIVREQAFSDEEKNEINATSCFQLLKKPLPTRLNEAIRHLNGEDFSVVRTLAGYDTMKIDLKPVGYVISGVKITAYLTERRGSTSVVVASKRLKLPESLQMTSAVPSESEPDEEMSFPSVFIPSPTQKRRRQ